MLDRKNEPEDLLSISSSEESSPEIPRKNMSELTPEELTTEGFSTRFTYVEDTERYWASFEHLDELFESSHISPHEYDTAKRDAYFAALQQYRKSDYFQSLKSKLEKQEKLIADEYLYYILVTDNVNELDLQVLKDLSSYGVFRRFILNLKVLIAAREWQLETDPAKKKHCNVSLLKALEVRGCMRTKCDLYLNLHGINLSGADLSGAYLDYTDLGHANLSKANLYCTEMHMTNLDYADLSFANCVRPNSKAHDGPLIRYSTAKHAKFDGIDAPNIDWLKSDFTGSSFKNAKIGHGHFSEAIFDETDFDGGCLSFFSAYYETRNCSLRNANFVNAEFKNPRFSLLDLSQTKLIAEDAFSNLEKFNNEFDVMVRDLLDTIKESRDMTKKIIDFQNTIAKNIIYHIGEAKLSTEDKLALFNKALEHPLFQPAGLWKECINNIVEKTCWEAVKAPLKLFEVTRQPQDSADIAAIRLLEAERDKLAYAKPRHVAILQ